MRTTSLAVIAIAWLGTLWIPGALVAASGPESDRVLLSDGVPATVAWPASRRPAPAIILAHDERGLSAPVRELATQLARHGYVVIVPDRARGGGAGEDPLVRRPRPEGALDEAVGTLDAAVAWLRAHARVGSRPIGMLGFSTGGALTIEYASRRDGLAAVVAYHAGASPAVAGALAGRATAIQVHRGALDSTLSSDDVEKFREALAGRRAVTELFTYGGAGPGFHDQSRPSVFHADAARQAWARTLTFFQKHLREDS